MTLFDAVKDGVTTRQAAERYGLQVGRQGMCKCPFHNDRNPSMKVDKRFHCFGCQADGDVINFTARLFDLSLRDAASKLAGDFGIAYDSQQTVHSERKHREASEEEIFTHKASYCFNELVSYRNLLIQWQQQFAPQSPDEDPDPRFLEAIHNLEIVEYELDTLLTGADFEKKQIVRDFFQERNSKKEGSGLEPIVKAPIYPHSSAYARERGELDLFRESYQANISCKKDIEKSISGHFDGMRLDPEGAAEILKRYGPDRVSLVLAATVQLKAWDGRFSSANKDWAFTFDFPDAQTARGFDRRNDYAVSSHPAVLDGFISQVRQEIKALEKVAVKDTEKQAVNPTIQPGKRKNHEMER